MDASYLILYRTITDMDYSLLDDDMREKIDALMPLLVMKTKECVNSPKRVLNEVERFNMTVHVFRSLMSFLAGNGWDMSAFKSNQSAYINNKGKVYLQKGRIKIDSGFLSDTPQEIVFYNTGSSKSKEMPEDLLEAANKCNGCEYFRHEFHFVDKYEHEYGSSRYGRLSTTINAHYRHDIDCFLTGRDSTRRCKCVRPYYIKIIREEKIRRLFALYVLYKSDDFIDNVMSLELYNSLLKIISERHSYTTSGIGKQFKEMIYLNIQKEFNNHFKTFYKYATSKH